MLILYKTQKGFTLTSKALKGSRGFTLIELLVVIVILAVLSLIGVAAYRGLQAPARDVARKEDISAIAHALEVHRNSTSNTYQALNNNDFQSNSIPSSSSVTKYCISYITNPSDIGQLVEPGSWEDTFACPPDTLLSPPYTEVTASNPPSGATDWIVCARLETVNDVYCLKNIQ